MSVQFSIAISVIFYLCPCLASVSYLNVFIAESMETCSWACKTYCHVWGCGWKYLTPENWPQHNHNFLIVEQKEQSSHTFYVILHFQLIMCHQEFCFLNLNILVNHFFWCPLETDRVIPLVASVVLYSSEVMLLQNFLKVSKVWNIWVKRLHNI